MNAVTNVPGNKKPSSFVDGAASSGTAVGNFLLGITDFAAVAFCIGAGIYLLNFNSSGSTGIGNSNWLEIIAHGMGFYFIGKGLFVARSVQLARRLNQLVEGRKDI